MKNFLVALIIVIAGMSVPGNSASATEVCLADFQDSEWKLGQPDNVRLNSDLILSKASLSFVNLNGDYFKINFRPEDFRYIKFRIKAGLSQTYFLNSNSKLSFVWVYEGKSCLPRVIEIEANAVEPIQEFSSESLEIWTNNVSGLSGSRLNFKEVELAKEIFLKARDFVTNSPKIDLKYRNLDGVKNLTFDDYRANEYYENPIGPTIGEYIQTLIKSEYKSENPEYLKNLSYIFLNIQSYSPDGCIKFRISNIIKNQIGYEGDNSLYKSQPYGFYYFPKKQDCQLRVHFYDNNLETLSLGLVTIHPISETSNLTPKSKPQTITCIKGKLTKKVTAVKPKCPAGYKKK